MRTDSENVLLYLQSVVVLRQNRCLRGIVITVPQTLRQMQNFAKYLQLRSPIWAFNH